MSAPKKPLPNFGQRGRLGVRGCQVRGTVEGDRVVIQRREGENPRARTSFPNTPAGRAEAAAFGEGCYARLQAERGGRPAGPTFRPLTVRELWTAFAGAQDHLRAATWRSYRERWARFEIFHGPHRQASELTRERLDEYRRALKSAEIAVNQIGHYLGMVKLVYRWGVDRDLIPPTKVTAYRFTVGKDERRLEVGEYTREEADAILAQLDPRDSRTWRAWVAVVLFAYTGRRQRAVLSLRWDDVDLAAGTVAWRAALDKNGRDEVMPLPDAAREALWVAYGWRTAVGYRGPWVFVRPGLMRAAAPWLARLTPAEREAHGRRRALTLEDRPWTYAAFYARLRAAERAAKIPHRPFTAAHAFRRMVIGDLYARTGDLANAGRFVGSRDLRTLNRAYLKDRPEHFQRMADAIGGGED